MEPTGTQSTSADFLFFPSRKIFFFACAVFIFIAAILYESYIAAPSAFPVGQTVSITSGATLTNEADTLYEAHIIKSEFFFKAFLVIFNGSHGLIAGQYKFSEPYDVALVAWKLSHGIYGFKQVTLTVPEGTNIFQLADLVSEDFPQISQNDFLTEARPDDGYLFPDTYFLSQNSSASDVVSIMSSNFGQKIAPLKGEIITSGRSLSDTIIMASILEKEAATDTDRQIIAGILWKRLSKNMALQVDAAFAYVPGVKDITHLTSADLAINSPYNTYLHTGLPLTAISNPGLASIEDALHPIDTPYYYYLSDANGVMHYAVTLQDQDTNIAKYLGR